MTRKANDHLFFKDLKPAPAEMRTKLKVFSTLQSKSLDLSTVAHIKQVAREKITRLVCADHEEVHDSFPELSCGGSEWDLSCF